MNPLPPILVALVGFALMVLGGLRREKFALVWGLSLILFASGALIPTWLTLVAFAALLADGVLLWLTGFWSRHPPGPCAEGRPQRGLLPC